MLDLAKISFILIRLKQPSKLNKELEFLAPYSNSCCYMASSLDDMEAYELLQIELDRSLKQFLIQLPADAENKVQLQHFLNSWIEYICFVRHLWVWEEIVKESTNEAFLAWYEELSGEALNLALLQKFQHSFK